MKRLIDGIRKLRTNATGEEWDELTWNEVGLGQERNEWPKLSWSMQWGAWNRRREATRRHTEKAVAEN